MKMFTFPRPAISSAGRFEDSKGDANARAEFQYSIGNVNDLERSSC